MLLFQCKSPLGDGQVFFSTAMDKYLQVECRSLGSGNLGWAFIVEKADVCGKRTTWTDSLVKKTLDRYVIETVTPFQTKDTLVFLDRKRYQVQGEYTCSLSDAHAEVDRDTAIIVSVCNKLLLIENRNRLTPDLNWAYLVPYGARRNHDVHMLKLNVKNILRDVWTNPQAECLAIHANHYVDPRYLYQRMNMSFGR